MFLECAHTTDLQLKLTVYFCRNMDSDVKDIFEVDREPVSSSTQQLSKEAIMGSLKVRDTPAEMLSMSPSFYECM